MKSREIKAYIKQLAKQPLILENWDERLWITVFDTATVHEDGRVLFRFKNGTEIVE